MDQQPRARRVNVRTGSASRWHPEFELESTSDDVHPADLDYAALVASRWTPPPFDSSCLRYVHAGLHQGGLYLYVAEAPDSIGFLGAVLRQFEGLGLVVDQLQVETHEGRIYDELAFRSLDGLPVGVDTLRGVRLQLNRYVAA